MSAAYFDPAVGGDGTTVTDDKDPNTGLDAGGYITRFVPALSQVVAVARYVAATATSQSNAAFTPCRFATVTNDTLSGLATRNGVTPVAGNRVLVLAQTAGAANGIYIAAAGAWARAGDANTSALFPASKLVAVQEGTVGAGDVYFVATIGAFTLGTTTLTFTALPSKTQANLWSGVQTYLAAANEAQGANIASAASINLTAASGNFIHVTGTTGISVITLAQGAARTVVFDGSLTLTNGANLILPGLASITTQPGDVAVFRGEASAVVRCVGYMPAASGPTSALPISGGNLTGVLGMSGAAINESQAANIASASSVNFTAMTGNYGHVTGTSTINTITLAQGARRLVVFDGILTLTVGASLILPGGASITTAPGDIAEFEGEASGVVRCTLFMRADGSGLRGLNRLPTQDSTSGTALDFNGIPSWASRITVMFCNVSTNGTSPLMVQLRGIGGLETSGYIGGSTQVDTSISSSTYSAGFTVGDANSASQMYSGQMVLSRFSDGGTGSNNTFCESHTINSGSGTFTHIGGGNKPMGSTVSGVRITTANGTDTFDNGFVCVMYE